MSFLVDGNAVRGLLRHFQHCPPLMSFSRFFSFHIPYSLQSNSLGDTTGRAIAEALEKNTTLSGL